MMESTTGSSTESLQNKSKAPVYADPNAAATFSLQDAKDLKSPTPQILCTLADNTFIRFGEYSVVDYDSRTQLLFVSEEMNEVQDQYAR